jgi:hypothetical protein
VRIRSSDFIDPWKILILHDRTPLGWHSYSKSILTSMLLATRTFRLDRIRDQEQFYFYVNVVSTW